MNDMLDEQERNHELKENSMLRKRITAGIISNMSIANKPIQKVTADKIKEGLAKFVDERGKYNYSQSYLNKIYSLLREVFNQAVIDDKLNLEQNPFKIKGKVKKPKSSKKTKKVTALNIEETKLFLKQLTIEQDKYKDAIWVLTLTRN
jgi:integrase